MSVRLLLMLAGLALGGCAILQDRNPEEPAPPPAQPEARVPPSPPVEAQPEASARVEPELPPARVEFPVPQVSDLERLLLYFEQVKKLPAPELNREHDSARAQFTRTKSDFDRMRLAMVLSLPNTPVSDEQRAVELLEPVVKSHSSLRGLASLMSAHLQERRRLESGVQNLQQNVQGLQQKLDALMSLERSLVDRDQATPGRKR